MFLRKFTPFILIVFLFSACTSAEVLNIEHNETIAMVNFPAKNFVPLPKYTVSGITFLPVAIRDQANDRMYFSIRAYSKNQSATFKIQHLVVRFDNKELDGTVLLKGNEDIQWTLTFNDWYTYFERIKAFNYTELYKKNIDQVTMVLSVIIPTDDDESQKDITYTLKAENQKYVGY